MSRLNAPECCDRCRTEGLTRLYFNGWLCTRCAPSEAQILRHAIDRAVKRHRGPRETR
jgi:ribosomal protein L37AE/L43A